MKLRNWGFTLIEMLGVFTILAIIMIISLPAITKNLKKNEVNKYEAFIKSAELAAETYIESHRESYPSLNNVGGSATVTLELLKSENLIDDIPKRPDGSTISTATTIRAYVNNDKIITYTYQE